MSRYTRHMALDDELVRQARSAAARLVDCERDLDRARGDYYHAVGRLHLSGASMREIAEALELSHQRVHQIIDSVGGNRRRWRRSMACDPNDLFCSFCGVAQKQVRTLVAGPGVFICSECVPVASEVVAVGRAGGYERTTLEPVAETSTRDCSFCRRAAKRVGRMAGGIEFAICGPCLDLCKDIVEEKSIWEKKG